MSNSRKLREERLRKKKQKKTISLLAVGSIILIVSGTVIGFSAWKNRPNQELITVSGQPSLLVDQELIDYGDVKFDTPKTFMVTLTNVGDEPLKISDTPYVEVWEGC
jgi:cell division septal protein FtsQ